MSSVYAVPSTSFYVTQIIFIFQWLNILTHYLSFSIERECSIPEMDTYLNAYPRKDTFKVGDVLKFSCSQGRIMVGADSVQCYHFGWSPRLPACKGKYLSDSCWSKSWDFRYQPFYFPPLIFCPLSVHL